MPKRTSSKKRVDSTDVQGDDSYMVITLPTVASAKESKVVIEHQQNLVAIAQRKLAQIQAEDDATDGAILAAAKEVNEAKEKLEEISRAELAKHIIDWNWVDDEGEPLPKPHNNPKALELLTAGEMNWLSTQFSGVTPQKK